MHHSKTLGRSGVKAEPAADFAFLFTWVAQARNGAIELEPAWYAAGTGTSWVAGNANIERQSLVPGRPCNRCGLVLYDPVSRETSAVCDRTVRHVTQSEKRIDQY